MLQSLKELNDQLVSIKAELADKYIQRMLSASGIFRISLR